MIIEGARWVVDEDRSRAGWWYLKAVDADGNTIGYLTDPILGTRPAEGGPVRVELTD